MEFNCSNRLTKRNLELLARLYSNVVQERKIPEARTEPPFEEIETICPHRIRTHRSLACCLGRKRGFALKRIVAQTCCLKEP